MSSHSPELSISVSSSQSIAQRIGQLVPPRRSSGKLTTRKWDSIDFVKNAHVENRWGVPKNRWTILENPIEMDDLGGTQVPSC